MSESLGGHDRFEGLARRNIWQSYLLSQGDFLLQNTILKIYFDNNPNAYSAAETLVRHNIMETSLGSNLLKFARGKNHKTDDVATNNETDRLMHGDFLDTSADSHKKLGSVGKRIVELDKKYLTQGRPRSEENSRSYSIRHPFASIGIHFALIEPCYDPEKIESLATEAVNCYLQGMRDPTVKYQNQIEDLRFITEIYKNNFPELAEQLQPLDYYLS